LEGVVPVEVDASVDGAGAGGVVAVFVLVEALCVDLVVAVGVAKCVAVTICRSSGGAKK
jgi:hypothetical protein